MKKKKVALIIIILLIIIVISTFFIINNLIAEGRKYEIEKVENYDYFILRQNNKYGVIDKNANTIIDAKYDNVIIPNPSKDVFICKISDSDSLKVFNKNNEELFANYEEVDAIRLKNIASDLMYEKSVLKYKQNGKYGIIDFSGKELTKPVYDEIDSLEFKEGELLVKQNDKFGVINIKGNILIPVEYENVKVDNYYTEENGYKEAGYIVEIKTEEGYRYGYIDIYGNTILDTQYNEISRVTDIIDENNIYFIASKNGQFGINKNKEQILNYEYQSISYDKSNNIFIIEKSKRYGMADIDGNIKIPVEYLQIDISGQYVYANGKDGVTTVFNTNGQKVELNPNISKLDVNGKYDIVITNSENETLYGVEDKAGNDLIKSEYTYIEYLFNNYFIVCNKEGKLGVLDDEGKSKIELKFDSVQKIKDTNLVQTSITLGNTTQVYNENLEKIYEMEDATISKVNDNYIKVENNQEVKYFNSKGEEISNTEVYKNNKLFAKNINNKWGFADNAGAIKIEATYDKVTEFNEYGFAGIKQGEKWGVIDDESKIILEPKYEFSSKLTPEFLGKYYKVTYGYGEIYYTDEQK